MGRRKRENSSRRLTSCLASLRHLDISGLLSFRSLYGIKVDTLTFLQCFKAWHLYRGIVNEEIFAAAIRGNESKTLRIVEPLHSTRCHICIPSPMFQKRT